MDKQQREYIHHLMLQYSDAMVRLTYRRVGDWHLAEDLVQETFLTACCKSERVCGHKKPVAWLFETLNNLTLREMWGDRIFEKCGIGRDERGDGGKTLEIRGKRRLPARDGGANYQQS